MFTQSRDITFPNPVLLTVRQRFTDATPVVRSKKITIDFGYPFIIESRICSGFDEPPCQIPITFTNKVGFFTKADLSRLIKKTYKSLFQNNNLETFHRPESLIINGLEKKKQDILWRLNISS